MEINGRKTYLFNPFDIKNWDNEKVKLELDMLIDAYALSANTMYEISLNVENLANQNYLIGEMVARLSEEYLLLKYKVNADESKQIYIQRRQWMETNDNKPPAMSYFEAMASDFVADDKEVLAKKESDLKRFKMAYTSMEEKINANKKKIDAIKVEEFGKR